MRSRMEWRWDILGFYVRCSHIADRADKKKVMPYIIQQLMYVNTHPPFLQYILINLPRDDKSIGVNYSYDIFIYCKICDYFAIIYYPTRVYFKLHNTSICQRLSFTFWNYYFIHSSVRSFVRSIVDRYYFLQSSAINASYVNIGTSVSSMIHKLIKLYMKLHFDDTIKFHCRFLSYRTTFSFYYIRERNENEWQYSLFTCANVRRVLILKYTFVYMYIQSHVRINHKNNTSHLTDSHKRFYISICMLT